MKFAPHNYQQYCIDRLLLEPALGLFLDMGLGKTVTALSAVKELKYYRFAIHKVLVIAPKKVAEATWSKEAAKRQLQEEVLIKLNRKPRSNPRFFLCIEANCCHSNILLSYLPKAKALPYG